MDCIERCPVDCFYAGENMLVIHLDEGIDCGACEAECPAEAIKPDTETGLESWLKLNEEFSAKWPNSPSRRAPGRCERMGRRAGQAALSQQRTARGLARAEAAAQDEERKACAVIFRLSPKVALAADEVCIEALARAQYERLHPEDTFDDLKRRAFR